MNIVSKFEINSRFLIPLAMMFVVINLASDVIAFRFYHVGCFVVSASGLIYPLSFCITDCIAEIYGYSIARNIIWLGLGFELIFAIIVSYLVRIPLPDVGNNANAFAVTTIPILRFVLSCIVGDIAGIFLNVYCITRSSSFLLIV